MMRNLLWNEIIHKSFKQYTTCENKLFFPKALNVCLFVMILNTYWRASHLISLGLILRTMAVWKYWQCDMGWWGAGPQQLYNDEIDIWQPVTGDCWPICLSVSTERWMTLPPHIGGNIHSAAMSWEAHHNPSSSCPSPFKTEWHV